MRKHQTTTTTTDPARLPPRGLTAALFNAAHDCFPVLPHQHQIAWQALRAAPDEAVALYPCFVDGRATTAIGLVQRIGNKMVITPLFLAPTDAMEITGHAGQPTVDDPYDEASL